MPDYSSILAVNFSDKKWILFGNSYDGLNWNDPSPKPTQAELDALWESTQTTVANQQATSNCHNAYVAESDPLFFKAQRGEGTMADWEAKVAEIKARYPKV
jgi:hypothetical protein